MGHYLVGADAHRHRASACDHDPLVGGEVMPWLYISPGGWYRLPESLSLADVLTGAVESRHTRARSALLPAFESLFGRPPTPAEIQIAQAIALHEGGYGEGRYVNMGPLQGTPDYGNPRAEGVIGVTGTNNWGAIQASGARGKPPCGENTVEITDTSPRLVTSENPRGAYQVCLRTWPTPEDGARAFLQTLYTGGRKNVLLAAATGVADSVAAEMYRTKYFEGFSKDASKEISRYADRIMANAESVSKGTGEPLVTKRGNPVSPKETPPLTVSGSTPTVAIVATLGGIGAILVITRKG